MFQLEYGFQCR